MEASRIRQAFQEPGNLLGLAGTVAATFALSVPTFDPVPLLIGAVAETAYLLFVPDSRWFTSRLAKRQGLAAGERWQQLREQTLPALSPAMQQRFKRLEQMRGQIGTQSHGQEAFYGDVLQKLDYLLEQFLLFAGKDSQFRTYLRSVLDEARNGTSYAGATGRPGIPQPSFSREVVGAKVPPAASDTWTQATVAEIQKYYDRDLASVGQLTAQEGDADTKAVLEKRADVLARRKEYVGKIGKILTNLNYQLQLVEDTYGLINDEIRARSPEQVLAEIEDVVTQTDTMTKTLEEIAPYEQSQIVAHT